MVIVNLSDYNIPLYKPLYSSELSYIMINVQRSSPGGRVEPQVKGGRKILVHIIYGMTNDLRTYCNGSDIE